MSFKVNNISFCGKNGDNIMTKDSKEIIINILKKKYNINFKSNRAMILNNKSLKYLRNSHFISVKTTGTNYFLFLTNIDNINYAFYIDRKIKQGYNYPRIISVKYSFKDEVFKDTLIDGELVKDDNNNWMFLISDLIIAEGTLLKQNISSRINYLYEILDKKYREDKYLDICPLIVKRFFNYNQYNELVTIFLPNLKYGIRGLYFNSINPKHATHLFLYSNNDKNNTNNKDNKDNRSTRENCNTTCENSSNSIKTLTFKIKKTIQPEVYDLYYIDNSQIVKYDNARISNLKTSKLVSKLFKENDDVFVKCNFNNKFNKWEPFEHSEESKLCSKKDTIS